MSCARVANALAASVLLIALAGCGGSDDAGSGTTDTSDTSRGSSTTLPAFGPDELIALVASSDDLAGTSWTIQPPFADAPDPTPNPTDCAAFDPIFALGDLPAVISEFGDESTQGTHSIRILDDAVSADATMASIGRVVETCPALVIAGGASYEASTYSVSNGRGLVLAGGGTQIIIVVQTSGRIVSTIEVNGAEVPAASVASLVEGTERRLAAAPD